MRTRSSRRLMCEPLERRLCMSGNVSVSVTDGVLSVTGDAAANNVEIQQLAPQGSQDPWPGFRYEIIGRDGTLINGTPPQPGSRLSRVTVEGVKSGVEVFLAAGNDVLRVNRYSFPRANLPGNVSIVMGNGQDDARLYLGNHQKVTVQMGGDDDSLTMGGCIVNGLTVQTDWVPSPPAGAYKEYADGADNVHINFLSANGLVDLTTGGKADSLGIGLTQLRSKLSIDTGGGDDVLGIGQISGATNSQSVIAINTGNGNDFVNMATASGGTYSVTAGSGNDKVMLGGGNVAVFDAITIWLGTGDDELQVHPLSCKSARFDGGSDTDAISGTSDAEFESLVVTNFES